MSSSKRDLGVDLELSPTVKVEHQRSCRECGLPIDSTRRRQTMLNVKLFGIGGGWRLCLCRQILVKGWGPKKQLLDPATEQWPKRMRDA